MKRKIPISPFATRLSGSAKETELRLRNIFQWKKKRPPVILLLAAILLVVGCGSVIGFTSGDTIAEDDQTLDFSPQEEESENTSPAAPVMTDSRAVLEYVDAVFASEQVYMQCWLFPGTGPVGVPIGESYEQVRAVFGQYTWTRKTGEELDQEEGSDTWYLDFYSAEYPDGFYNITAQSNGTWIRIDTPASVGSAAIYYSYDGEPGSLNDALADLWEGPGIRYALVTLPESVAGSETLAEAYADAFRELYLASGAITDYELLSVGLLGEDPGPSTPSFTMTYRVKPVHPTASCWEYYAPGEDGWATCSVEMHLNLAGDESAEESVWRAAWWEYL